MAALFPDSSEETERVLIELLRQKSPAERAQMAANITESVRQLVKGGLQARYPNADAHELRCRFTALWLGREWAIRLYGWDPEKHGW
mgnify:CR=1 FL=1